MFDVIQAALNQVRGNIFYTNAIYFISRDYIKHYKAKSMINRLKKK